jgi:RimJ/RimL family protein N-acetyltransferase
MVIKIRTYELKDVESHCNAVKMSIESLKKWFSWAKPNYCLCDSIKFINEQLDPNNKEKFNYAIIDTDDEKNQLVGSCGLRIIKTYNGERIASMSYWCREDRQGQHITRCAVKQLLDKAKNLPIVRIEIDAAHCNVGSEKIAKRFGNPERDITIWSEDDYKKHDATRYVWINPKDRKTEKG